MKPTGYVRAVQALLRCTGVFLCLALGACASQEPRCEGKLEPINPPAPPSVAPRADEQHGQ